MGILDSSKVTLISTDTYEVGPAVGGVYMNLYNYSGIASDYIYRINDTELCINFCSKVLNGNFNSILIGGLGLGAVPQYIAENTSCEIIDIIELNQDIIDTMTSFDVYSPKLNIVRGDLFNFTPTKTYDVIMFDIWTPEFFNPSINSEVENLRTLYNSYLNENGFMYFPILGINGGQDTFNKI